MTQGSDNRFDDFYADENYLSLKNYLYNYLLRKRAVEKAMEGEAKDLVLEIGSGISPVFTSWERVVYSDLSAAALEKLKKIHGQGQYVVADAENLPFANESFSQVIASEVLEHLEDDRLSLREISRVTRPGGTLIVTFPHRHFYFARDDRFVHHYRRYELAEMKALLEEAGFFPVLTRKVLGPLEKLTMLAATGCAELMHKLRYNAGADKKTTSLPDFFVSIFKTLNCFYAGLAALDAFLMPVFLSTVLLIKAKKR